MKMKSLSVFAGLLLSSAMNDVHAQKKTVGITINQDTNEPIAGASVTRLSTGDIYLTNEFGIFELPATTGDMSVSIRHVGFEPLKEQKLSAGDTTVLFLRPLNKVIEEVSVYTGYQTIPKERATGNFEHIDKQTIGQIVTSNIIDKLEGTSTLLFDKHSNRPKITLRGLNTIYGTNEPLIVIDNFPFEGDIESINPDDVESVTLLKDAAATSIWGSRAGNGVIVITTKKAKFNTNPHITFDSNVQLVSKPDLGYFNLINTSDLVNLEKNLFELGHYNDIEFAPNRPYISPVVQRLIDYREGRINESELNHEIDKLRPLDIRDQYTDGVYAPAVNQFYNLAFNAGSERISIYLGAGWNQQRDNLGSVSNRFNLRNSSVYKLSKSAELSVGLAYSRRNVANGREGYDPAGNTRPYVRLYDKNRNALPIPRLNQGYVDSVMRLGLLDWYEYPYDEYHHNERTTASENIQANFNVSYRAAPWLTLGLLYGAEMESTQLTTLHKKESYYVRDLVNRFSQYEESSNRIISNVPYGDIRDETQDKLWAHNVRGQINIAKTWRDHNLHVIAGGEVRSTTRGSIGGRIYGFDREVLTTTRVDYNTRYNDFVNGGLIQIPYKESVRRTVNNFLSAYFNGSYSYKSRYTFSASLRRDASNLFGLSTNDKWQPLWSIGGAWDITKESFYISESIPSLKLKATYGKSGLINPSMTAVTTLDYRSPTITDYIGAVIYRYPNPELRWEKSAMLNVGLDFGIWNNRISGNISYFNKKNTDLFGPSPMDLTSGVGSTITRNIADIKGNGWDANIQMDWLTNRITWNTRVLFSYNESTVADFYNTATASSFFVSRGGSINPIIGRPLYSIISYPFLGLDNQGNPVSSIDGTPSSEYVEILNANYNNLVVSGSAIPLFYGSVSNSLSWADFMLTVNVSYKFGHFFAGDVLAYNGLINMDARPGSGYFTQRWTKAGDELHTVIPRFEYPVDNNRERVYSSSTVNIHKADHIRLNFIRFGYRFYTARYLKRPISVQAFLNAENLGLIWKAAKVDLDPDYAIEMPQPKRFSFGLNVNF